MRFSILLSVLLLSACPKPKPDGLVQRVVSCGSSAVKGCGREIVPVVLGCLDSHLDVRSCLIGAGSSGLGCLAFDVVACAAREQRDVIPMQALMDNGPTSLQVRRSARAAEYLESIGVVFDDGR